MAIFTGSNADYVEQYNNQRENLRQTILQLKNNQDSIIKTEDIEKEKKANAVSNYDSTLQLSMESVVYPHKATVKVAKTYFYDEPEVNSLRHSYIIIGQEIQVLDSEGDFVYVSFDNNRIITKGWLLRADLEDNE
ncbi:MAG: hypothetical protein IPJ86_06445 [Bacteroidetes bacterium]|nr:hypothetical protein [Bacteroidota bacterium]